MLAKFWFSVSAISSFFVSRVWLINIPFTRIGSFALPDKVFKICQSFFGFLRFSVRDDLKWICLAFLMEQLILFLVSLTCFQSSTDQVALALFNKNFLFLIKIVISSVIHLGLILFFTRFVLKGACCSRALLKREYHVHVLVMSSKTIYLYKII